MSKLFRYGGRVARLDLCWSKQFYTFQTPFLLTSFSYAIHKPWYYDRVNAQFKLFNTPLQVNLSFLNNGKKKKNRLKRKVVSYKLQTMNQSDWRLIYKEPINRFYYSRNYILRVIFGGQSTILNVHLGILIFISIFY